MIRTPALTKTYGDFTLKLPEMEFEPGKIYAVIGANGSGKSTMAKMLLKMELAGGMLQKSFAFRMSVKKNVMLAASSEARAEALLEQLELSGIKDKNAKELSGGQTARMALARALAGEFPLLVLDEPTASMDMQSTLQAEACVRDYADGNYAGNGNSCTGTGADVVNESCNKKHAVLLITHSIPQAQRIADEIIFIESGRIAERGKTAQLLTAPTNPKTKAFLKFVMV